MRETRVRGKALSRGRFYDGAYYDKGDWIAGALIITSRSVFEYLVAPENHEREYYILSNRIQFMKNGLAKVMPIRVDPETVGYVTDKADKNGIAMSEGDIFITHYANVPNHKYVVEYHPKHTAYMARCVETDIVHFLDDFCSNSIEIIGDAHDNPGLLEVDK